MVVPPERSDAMCDSREGKYVVSIRPTAGMGWWIGQIQAVKGRFYEIGLLWVEKAEERSKGSISSTAEYVKEFDGEKEAMDWLQSKGAEVSASA
ncbi:MAG: hypothetical protein Q8Q48_00370 [Candidatus Staskawiczbacteria bacterium]|nr:hypothetical protein [Candidatus Staskawiczbacteria bacterium]